MFTIGTGCCESTAPFLYEDFWPGSDQEVVGEVAGVSVYAPEYVRRLYPDDDGVVIDVEEDYLAESLSIETEWSCRFTLRTPGFSPQLDAVRGPMSASVDPVCRTNELPEGLRGLRIR